MTWVKLSDDFPLDTADLSDKAFRVHTEGLCWTMQRLTGGKLSERDLKRGIETEDYEQAVDELCKAGLWAKNKNGYTIKHHMCHQPTPKEVEAKREKDRLRQQNYRKKVAETPYKPKDLSQRDITRDATSDPGRDGTGRDGPYQGSDDYYNQSLEDLRF